MLWLYSAMTGLDILTIVTNVCLHCSLFSPYGRSTLNYGPNFGFTALREDLKELVLVYCDKVNGDYT